MPTRAKRLKQNEDSASQINEAIRSAIADGDGPAGESMLIVCECAHVWCEEIIEVSLSAYTELRSRLSHYAVVPEHVVADVERVVEEHGDYVVVTKI